MSLGVAYTTQATYELFVANSAEGEMGVFNNDTHALVSGAGAASTTINLFVAVNRGGTKGPWSNSPQVPNVIEKSPIFQIQNCVPFRQPYDAPVAQVSVVQLLSHATIVVQDVTFVSKAVGAASPITVIYAVAGNNTALSAGAVGNVITVNLSTNGGGVATATASQVAAIVNSTGATNALVRAFVSGTGSTVEVAAGSTAATGGSAAATITPGNVYNLAILETTPGYQPYPTWSYQYVAVAGDTEDVVMTKLAAKFNSTTSVDNRDRDLIVTAAYASGVMTLTAIYFGSTFNVLFPGLQFPALLTDNALPSIAVTFVSVPCHAGSGAADQARLFQQAGDEYKGVTTQYPLQGAQPADYGQPDDFVALNVVKNFDIFSFSITSTENSKTFLHKQSWTQNLFVIVPTSGTTPTAQIKNIFGL